MAGDKAESFVEQHFATSPCANGDAEGCRDLVPHMVPDRDQTVPTKWVLQGYWLLLGDAGYTRSLLPGTWLQALGHLLPPRSALPQGHRRALPVHLRILGDVGDQGHHPGSAVSCR